MTFSTIDLELLQLYNEPHRRYHSVFHVLEMLEMHRTGETRGLVLGDYRMPDFGLYESLFQTAVIAHDCVYQIGKPKAWNENESFRAWETLGIVGPSNLAYDLIAVTINHDPQRWNYYDQTRNLMIRHMSDLDMAPLGASREEYDRNSANLKAEFMLGGVDEEAYEIGRRAFLTKTLEEPRIFYTDQFQQLDKPARDNMTRALEPGYGL